MLTTTFQQNNPKSCPTQWNPLAQVAAPAKRQGSLVQRHDLWPLSSAKWQRMYPGSAGHSRHSHTPGLISLFLPMLLPAVSNPCSQEAKNLTASISAAASQSLFIINFIKGLGSPAPFQGPDSSEIMRVTTVAKALSSGISAHWYVHTAWRCGGRGRGWGRQTEKASTHLEASKWGSRDFQNLNTWNATFVA